MRWTNSDVTAADIIQNNAADTCIGLSCWNGTIFFNVSGYKKENDDSTPHNNATWSITNEKTRYTL